MASTMSGAINTPMPDYETFVPAPTYHSNGSIGPFFGVFAAILVLTLLSCIIGRVCGEHVQGPDSVYNCTALARRRCCWGCIPHRSALRGARSTVAVDTGKQPPIAIPQP